MAIDILFLDVGQGDASLIFLPTGGVIAFDCKDAHVLLKTLDSRDIRRLDALVLSHLDLDHVGGVPALLTAIEVKTIFVNRDRDISPTAPRAKKARKLVARVTDGDRRGTFRVEAATERATPIAEGDGWSVHLAAPRHATSALQPALDGRELEPNRHSVVLRVQVGDQARVLIGADAPLASWAQVRALSAEVFRVPHHGGAIDDGGIPPTWDVSRLYREVGADVTVISVGSNNRFNHPAVDWIRPLTGGACTLMCTQVTPRCHPDVNEGGGIRGGLARSSVGREGFVEPLWRHYRDPANVAGAKATREVPCAGTVVVHLAAGGPPRVLPSAAAHGAVVESWDAPLCRPPVT
ncbi:MAG: MBL fold metallo-hydrolase [Myxococcales bacterium]|nr:MBL fold metallo-hydrolase [Myxococcales bacterium]